MKITVSAIPYNDEDASDWYLMFTFEPLDDSWHFGFHVSEPGMRSLADWRDLADGVRGIRLYQGNGEGAIETHDQDLLFIAAPSGAGGDVAGQFRVPRALVAPHLNAALNEAVQYQFRFREFRENKPAADTSADQ